MFKKSKEDRVEALNFILRRGNDGRTLTKKQYEKMSNQNTRGMNDDSTAKEKLRLTYIENNLGYSLPENIRIQKSVYGYGTNRTGYIKPVVVPDVKTIGTGLANDRYSFVIEIAKKQNDEKYTNDYFIIVDMENNLYNVSPINEIKDKNFELNFKVYINQIVVNNKFILMYYPKDDIEIEKLANLATADVNLLIIKSENKKEEVEKKKEKEDEKEDEKEEKEEIKIKFSIRELYSLTSEREINGFLIEVIIPILYKIYVLLKEEGAEISREDIADITKVFREYVNSGKNLKMRSTLISHMLYNIVLDVDSSMETVMEVIGYLMVLGTSRQIKDKSDRALGNRIMEMMKLSSLYKLTK